MKQNKYTKLVLCLLLDLVGYASYLFPGVGEFTDGVWAPIAAYLNYSLFKDQTGIGGSIFTLLEEGLPGTDFIPSFTLTWAYTYLFTGKKDKEKQISEKNS